MSSTTPNQTTAIATNNPDKLPPATASPTLIQLWNCRITHRSYQASLLSCLAHACRLVSPYFPSDSVLELRVDRYYYWWISRRPNTTLDGTSW